MIDLSPRETQMLQLIVDGCTNRGIAGEMDVALSTVKAMTKSVFLKLDAMNRTHAAMRGLALGLVTLPPPPEPPPWRATAAILVDEVGR